MDSDSAAPSRSDLRAHLIASRIAGDIATTRQENLHHYGEMSDREPHYLFGLEPAGRWTRADVLALMAERCGVSPDPAYLTGRDTIDPVRTLDRLEAMAARVAEAVRLRERVIVATGHPVGLRPTHTALARALREADCPVLTPAAGWAHRGDPWDGDGTLGYVEDVAVLLGPAGIPRHTHSPVLLEAMLEELRVTGEAPPELVIADHGWAGAAGQAGIDAVGFADSNDPALFVGEAEGRVRVAVPLDDNVAAHLYAPLTAYLLDRAGLAESGLAA